MYWWLPLLVEIGTLNLGLAGGGNGGGDTKQVSSLFDVQLLSLVEIGTLLTSELAGGKTAGGGGKGATDSFFC